MPKGGTKKNKRATASFTNPIANITASGTGSAITRGRVAGQAASPHATTSSSGNHSCRRPDPEDILAGLEHLRLREASGNTRDLDDEDDDLNVDDLDMNLDLGIGMSLGDELISGATLFSSSSGGALGEDEISPRLLVLQQQLEKLEAERHASINIGSSGNSPSHITTHMNSSHVNTLHINSPQAKVTTTTNTTEVSLYTLKKRLSKVRKQLYGGAPINATINSPANLNVPNVAMSTIAVNTSNGINSNFLTNPSTNAALASLAKSYFGGVLRPHARNRGKRILVDGFVGEGDAFNDGEDGADVEGIDDTECIEDIYNHDENNSHSNRNSNNRDPKHHHYPTNNNNDGITTIDSGGIQHFNIMDRHPSDGLSGVNQDVDDDEYEFSEAEFLEDELLAAAAAAGVDLRETLAANNFCSASGAASQNFLNSVRLVRKLFPSSTLALSNSENNNLNVSPLSAPDEGDTIMDKEEGDGEIGEAAKAILELQDVLIEILNASSTLASTPGNEQKVAKLREKLQLILRYDRIWRIRLTQTARLAHDERMQRQLIEMELDKAQAIRHRLEGLCRDLHAENRRMKAEKLQTTPDNLNAANDGTPCSSSSSSSSRMETFTPPSVPAFSLGELPNKNILAGESNATLADRIVNLADLFLLREQHFAQVLRLKEGEIMAAQERASNLAEQLTKQTSMLDVTNRRVTALTRSEAELKAQVRQYVDKFRQVEETLGKSNDLFGTFRAEMEQMGAKLARLERENTQLNSKCATLSKNIIEMADERTRQTAQYETLKGQKVKLEALCRTLQAERNAALKGITPLNNTGGEVSTGEGLVPTTTIPTTNTNDAIALSPSSSTGA